MKAFGGKLLKSKQWNTPNWKSRRPLQKIPPYMNMTVFMVKCKKKRKKESNPKLFLGEARKPTYIHNLLKAVEIRKKKKKKRNRKKEWKRKYRENENGKGRV